MKNKRGKSGRRRPSKRPRARADDRRESGVSGPGAPTVKLSDALMDVARPILSHPLIPEDPDALRAVLLTAGVAWNAARAKDPEREREMLGRLAEGMTSRLGFPPDAASEMVRILERRVRKLYPDDPRWVADVQVEEREDEFRIQALSMMEPPATPRAPEAPEPEAKPGPGSKVRGWLAGLQRDRRPGGGARPDAES